MFVGGTSVLPVGGRRKTTDVDVVVTVEGLNAADAVRYRWVGTLD